MFETNIINQILFESSQLISYIIIKSSLKLKLSVNVFEIMRTKSLKF